MSGKHGHFWKMKIWLQGEKWCGGEEVWRNARDGGEKFQSD
jgi:hypothetical protein